MSGLCAWPASRVEASVTYPGPFVGTDFTYSNVVEVTTSAGDPEPLYGMPQIVSGNTLDFDPNLYAFSADAPPPDTTNSTLSFVYESNTAAVLPYLLIYEDGDYLFSGSTPSGEIVSATIFVQIRDFTTNVLLRQASITFSEVFDLPVVESDFWSLTLFVPLDDLNRTKVKVTINNLLTASASNSGSSIAYIQKKEFQIDPVPEPASLMLLALAALALTPRRRRSA